MRYTDIILKKISAIFILVIHHFSSKSNKSKLFFNVLIIDIFVLLLFLFLGKSFICLKYFCFKWKSCISSFVFTISSIDFAEEKPHSLYLVNNLEVLDFIFRKSLYNPSIKNLYFLSIDFVFAIVRLIILFSFKFDFLLQFLFFYIYLIYY